MTKTAINFITEEMLKKIELLNIQMDDKVTIVKELGKTLKLAKNK